MLSDIVRLDIDLELKSDSDETSDMKMSAIYSSKCHSSDEVSSIISSNIKSILSGDWSSVPEDILLVDRSEVSRIQSFVNSILLK